MKLLKEGVHAVAMTRTFMSIQLPRKHTQNTAYRCASSLSFVKVELREVEYATFLDFKDGSFVDGLR